MKHKTTRRLFLRHVASMLASQQVVRKFAHAELQAGTPSSRHSHLLWFDKPASQWADALPVGNGRLGAMVFGGFDTERIALNEDTLWSGAPTDWNNPDAPRHLAEVRRLVLHDKDYVAADRETRKMQGPYNAAYQPLGDLNIKLEQSGKIRNYRRELDLDKATCRVTYEAGGVSYIREIFVSYPAQVVVIRLKVSGHAGLNARVNFASALRSTSTATNDNTLELKGKAPNHSAPNYVDDKDPIQYSERVGEGMHFAAVLHASAIGGKIKSHPDGSLSLEGVQSAVLLVSMATGYKGFSVLPDTPLGQVVATAGEPLTRAVGRGYEGLLAEHLADHRRLYRRSELDLVSKIDGSALPTDQRVSSFQAKPDPALLALYFNFGRYLLITSSRPGTQPANLQGIWSSELRPHGVRTGRPTLTCR